MMQIPGGTEVYIGPPAQPMPTQAKQRISEALAGLPGAIEAHLPQCYVKGFIDPPAQVLFLVIAPNLQTQEVLNSVNRRLCNGLGSEFDLQFFLIGLDDPMLEVIRQAGCSVEIGLRNI